MNTPQETYAGAGRWLWTGTEGTNTSDGEERPRVICAWCEEVMEEGIGPVSHGMCPACHTAFLAMIPEE